MSLIKFEDLGLTSEIKEAFESLSHEFGSSCGGDGNSDGSGGGNDGCNGTSSLGSSGSSGGNGSSNGSGNANGDNNGNGTLELGRVTSLDRGYPLVNTSTRQFRAQLATNIKKSDDSIVAIGDWVAVFWPQNHEKAIIQKIFDRRTEIARIKRVGRENQVRRQVLAANVDKVFICQALGKDGLDKKLALRQIAAVCGSGAEPIFVFTKKDRVKQSMLEKTAAYMNAAFPQLEFIFVSVQQDVAKFKSGHEKFGQKAGVQSGADKLQQDGFGAKYGAGKLQQQGGETEANSGIGKIRQLCAKNTTSLLLGESGVGKSSLVNALLGSNKMATGSVREQDDKGRHTTVARRLLQIPHAGLIIDAPGLKTLQIINLEESLFATFPDIFNLAKRCKFKNCTHTHEPGCAVRGKINPVRLEAYYGLSLK